MPLVPLRETASAAAVSDHGVGAFNVIVLEHAEAIVAGAEHAKRPVVLQLSQNTADYHRGLAPLALACLRIAADSTAQVSVHLDHATRRDLVEQAVDDLGMGSVMYDAASLPYDENVSRTTDVTRWCHDRGVWVEAELGEVGSKDGAHAPGVRTDPGEAARFVAATGVDALAVAVGSSHAMLTRDAVLDLELIKVNIATHLNKALTAAARRALDDDPALVDPRRYLGPGREAVTTEVARLLGVLAP